MQGYVGCILYVGFGQGLCVLQQGTYLRAILGTFRVQGVG